MSLPTPAEESVARRYLYNTSPGQMIERAASRGPAWVRRGRYISGEIIGIMDEGTSFISEDDGEGEEHPWPWMVMRFLRKNGDIAIVRVTHRGTSLDAWIVRG